MVLLYLALVAGNASSKEYCCAKDLVEIRQKRLLVLWCPSMGFMFEKISIPRSHVKGGVKYTALTIDIDLAEEIQKQNFRLPIGMRRNILLKSLYNRMQNLSVQGKVQP